MTIYAYIHIYIYVCVCVYSWYVGDPGFRFAYSKEIIGIVAGLGRCPFTIFFHSELVQSGAPTDVCRFITPVN